MRIAVLPDIHGNRTAFEAVLADLQQSSPDLILHGGHLADAGARPVDIVDRVAISAGTVWWAPRMKCFSGPSRWRSLRTDRRRILTDLLRIDERRKLRLSHPLIARQKEAARIRSSGRQDLFLFPG